MKRIVNGVTYNTATSTRLARSRWDVDDSESVVGTLYQTRGGAFFVHQEITRQIWNETERQHEREHESAFVPYSPEDAHKWILEGDVEIFHNPFDDPPEATAEAEPGATIYIRVPASLKRRVDEAAKQAKISSNVFAMRCLERCLRNVDRCLGDEELYNHELIECIGHIWYIARHFEVHDTWKFKHATARKAFADVSGLAEELYDKLGLNKVERFDAAISDRPAVFEHWEKKFKPYAD
jgi:predicted HicB family RNase H-like nuclease